MRFFAHDGKAVHGPAVLDELLRLPGFDGDTLVCPVGSENSADWKPALAYPSFREALLAPAPKPAPPPPPPPPPAPAPTLACPRCSRANPEDARYCNACAARMDGFVEPPAAPPAAEPEPVASFPPLQSLSVEPSAPEPEVPAPVADLTPAAAPEPPPAAPPTVRKTLIASFAGAAVASGVLGWWLLRPAKHSAAPAVPGLEMPAESPTIPAAGQAVAPAPMPTPAPAPAPAPALALAPATMPATAPVAKPALAAKPAPRVDLNDLTKAPAPAHVKRARRRKPRARKPKPAPAPAASADGETLIESHAAPGEPAIPGGAPADAAPAEPSAPAQQEDRGFLLPGIPRRVPPSATKIKLGAAAPADKPADASAAAAAPAAAVDDPTTKQVREQFVFCAQLLSQGAFADHFDTCLCSDARSAAPYHGRRGYYAATLKKAAAAGTLATSAVVKGIILDGPIAKVTADWTSGASERPRTETENWQLEDGLWCRYP